MSKAKVCFGFAVIMGLLALSVVPASAWFGSTIMKDTTGKYFQGETTFVDEAATFTCVKVTGEWSVLAQAKGGLTKEGPVLDLVIPSSEAKPAGWKECNTEAGPVVSECELQLSQPSKGATSATVTVLKACEFKVPGQCIRKITAMKANTELSGVSLENSGSSLRANINVPFTFEHETLGGIGCIGVKNPADVGSEKATGTGESLNLV
jgi:hypothetical protein